MKNIENSAFQIKGIREGLLIMLGAGDWTDIRLQLLQHMRQNANFFMGARVALDAGNHNLNAAELGKFRDVLCDLDTSLWAVLSESPITIESARMLGMATKINLQKPDAIESKHDDRMAAGNLLLVEEKVAAGIKVESRGHVIILGDVDPGGEIVAGGSIIVWGHCRGILHAGSEGTLDAVVCALNLSPAQLRIADFTATLPKRKRKPKPEMAYVDANQVVSETWQPKMRKSLV
ncbi:MAG: hypothetical protein BGO78_15445 [Chloroflexi bacterium 44-23]|nr:MAG: hypothetical protein BGO78_15445 [Chloroflexi bacterium 44-23]